MFLCLGMFLCLVRFLCLGKRFYRFWLNIGWLGMGRTKGVFRLIWRWGGWGFFDIGYDRGVCWGWGFFYIGYDRGICRGWGLVGGSRGGIVGIRNIYWWSIIGASHRG